MPIRPFARCHAKGIPCGSDRRKCVQRCPSLQVFPARFIHRAGNERLFEHGIEDLDRIITIDRADFYSEVNQAALLQGLLLRVSMGQRASSRGTAQLAKVHACSGEERQLAPPKRVGFSAGRPRDIYVPERSGNQGH
jgi:hypothetical protein